MLFHRITTWSSTSAIAEILYGRCQYGSATSLMTVVCNRYSINCMSRFSLHDISWTMDRASAFVTDAGDCNAADRKVRSGHAGDLAAVAGGIVQPDYIRHDCPWYRYHALC